MSPPVHVRQCHDQGHGRRATLPSDEAFARLHALLDEAVCRATAARAVFKRAWTGKTALLRQFTDEAARRGVRVVWPPSFGSQGRRRTGSESRAARFIRGTREKSNNGPLASASRK